MLPQPGMLAGLPRLYKAAHHIVSITFQHYHNLLITSESCSLAVAIVAEGHTETWCSESVQQACSAWSLLPLRVNVWMVKSLQCSLYLGMLAVKPGYFGCFLLGGMAVLGHAAEWLHSAPGDCAACSSVQY